VRGRKAVRRASFGVALLAFAALLLSIGPLGSTFALFNGETENAGSTFAGGWVDAASGATATPSGYDIVLGWTAGTHGPVTGEQLDGVDNTTNSNCSGAAYVLLHTMPTAGTAAYTDASRGNATNDGDWYCYELVSTSATAWTGLAPLAAVQLGLAASGLSIANSGTAHTINANDTITITFNQKPTLPSNNGRVCVIAPSGPIIIGDSTANGNHACAATDAYNVGKLTLTGATLGTTVKYTTMTLAQSATAPWTITATLGGAGTSTVTGSPTWTFTPAAAITSSIATHRATVCSAAKTTCQPTSTSNF
jgi:hypothetical protein